MNKQEVIDEIENAIPDFIFNDYHRGRESGLTYALELVEELDEPEKPVVPQYVADMIIERKKQKQGIITTIKNLSVFEEAFAWIRKNEEAFAKAWVYGYEVEKEKLYTVEFPDPNRKGGGHVVLVKDGDDIIIDVYFNSSWKLLGRTKLTEAEIKKDFDWAWQFAEEVEK